MLLLAGIVCLVMGFLIRRGAKVFEKRILNNQYKEIPAKIKEFRRSGSRTRASMHGASKFPVYSYNLDGEEYTFESRYSYDEQDYTNEHVWGLYQDVNTGEVFEKPKGGGKMGTLLLIIGGILFALEILPLMIGLLLL